MISIFIIVVSLLLIARTTYVSFMHSRALNATSAAAQRNIRAHKWATWAEPYRVLEQHNFLLDVFNPRKWTYAQFFPDIPELEA